MTLMDPTVTRPYVASEPARPAARQLVDRARARWAGMAGRLGLGFCTAGFFMIFIAWNGAAGKDFIAGQLPYLISGGVSGLGLIIIGGALLIAESNRRDRAIIERQLTELNASMVRMGSARAANPAAVAAVGGASSTRGRISRKVDVVDDLVVTGRSSFHRTDCRLVTGRDQGDLSSRDEAAGAGLAPCRVCNP